MIELSSIGKLRSGQKARRDKAVLIMMAGNLPPVLKLICWQIIMSVKSGANYEWCWLAQSELVRRLDKAPRTIQRYLNYLRSLGIIKSEEMGPGEWRVALYSRYGYRLPKKKSGNHFPGFTILWEHPVWSTGKLSPDELASIRQKWTGDRMKCS